MQRPTRSPDPSDSFDPSDAPRRPGQVVPPTLFRLPDLAKQGGPKVAEPQMAPAMPIDSPATPINPPAPPINPPAASLPPTLAAPAAVTTGQTTTAIPTTQTQPVAPPPTNPATPTVAASGPQPAVNPSVPPATTTTVTPAAATATPSLGSLGSLGNVLLANKTIVGLLLAVIASAWYSGRSQPNRSGANDSRIATSTTPPDNLPPPNAIAAESNQTDPIEIELGLPAGFKVDPQSLARTLSNTTNRSAQQTGPTGVASPLQPAGDVAKMFAGFDNTPVQTVASRTADPINGVLTNMAAQPDHGIHSADRVNDAVATPQNDLSGGTPDRASGSPYRLSRTPNGVDDWSVYLTPGS